MQTPAPLDKVTIHKIFADINLKFFSGFNIFSIFSMWSHKAFVLGLMQHVSAILAPLVYRLFLIEHL